jgi:hypothetical protein
VELPYGRDQTIVDKWVSATELLQEEFNIAPERVHLLGTIKTLFTKYVGENDLSEESAHALYYRLVFFSTLMMIRTLNTMDMQVTGFDLKDLLPVFAASKRLSAEASDWDRLEQSISSINHAIDALIVDYS